MITKKIAIKRGKELSSDIRVAGLITAAAISSLILGVAAGYFGFKTYADMGEYYRIKYVAESELMSLEKARVEQEAAGGSSDKEQLFFGKIDNAVQLTAKIAASKNDNKTKVIFSLMPVFASGVESISEQVHRELIEQLRAK